MVIVKRKELSFSERLFLPEIARALSHSLRTLFRKKITRQYPEEPLLTTAVTRGRSQKSRKTFVRPRHWITLCRSVLDIGYQSNLSRRERETHWSPH